MPDDETKAPKVGPGDIVQLTMLPADSDLPQEMLGDYFKVLAPEGDSLSAERVHRVINEQGQEYFPRHGSSTEKGVGTGGIYQPYCLPVSWVRVHARASQCTKDPTTGISVVQAKAQEDVALQRAMAAFPVSDGKSLAERVIEDNGRLREKLRALEQELTGVRDEAEQWWMQLTACTVIADANTRESAKRMRQIQPEYRCAAVETVERAVDREMDLREENERLKEEIRKLRAFKAQVDEALNSGDGVYRP